MKEKPLVSVIMIFLNAEDFIQEAIESVFAQTYDNWELLLVDDGSTDSSAEIARRYSRLYPEKVRYLDHDGHLKLGKSTSRNLGIHKAKGDYIAFLDADDVFLPQKLERQVAILESHPQAGMVYGRTQYWYSWTRKSNDIKRDFMSKLGVQPNTLFNPPALLTRFLKDGGIVPCICSLLVRRRILEEIGEFEETIQHMYEDQVFLAKICLNAPVFVENECGERYRQHMGSSSYIAIIQGEYHPFWPNPARLAFLNWLSGYLSEKGINDSSLLKALQKGLRPYRYPNLYRAIIPVQYFLRQIKGVWCS
jgi:glycosyltransferase involved in cell wall biosynthesis